MISARRAALLLRTLLTLIVIGTASVGTSARPDPRLDAQLDEGTYVLIVTLRIAADKRDQFLALSRSRIRDSRADPAVVDFRLLATDDPLTFVAVEGFRSRAAFDTFSTTPGSVAFVRTLASLLAGRPDVQQLHTLARARWRKGK